MIPISRRSMLKNNKTRSRRISSIPARVSAPPPVTSPAFAVIYLREPALEFAFGQKLEYPRDGLFLFGPVDSKKNFSETRYGVIGTSNGVDRFRRWSATLRSYIGIPEPGPRSRSVEPQHV